MTIWFILSVWSCMTVLVMSVSQIIAREFIEFEGGWYIAYGLAWITMLASNMLFWLPFVFDWLH